VAAVTAAAAVVAAAIAGKNGEPALPGRLWKNENGGMARNDIAPSIAYEQAGRFLQRMRSALFAHARADAAE
jgi:hypothetical protein